MARRSSIWFMVVVLAAAAWAYWNTRQQPPPPVPDFHAVPAGHVLSENHFSPAENLEQLDVARLEEARSTIDIAMYAFTDDYLATRLRALAARGVKIRLYRDRSQYEQEQRNAAGHNDTCATDQLRGEPNIEVRIKADRGRNIMHLKAYLVDGKLLRDGSANWSPSGLKSQDNNAHFTNDPAQVRALQQDFETMWQRPDNLSPR
ncbi:MAG: phospholipase D-like domain-containing protein [Acidobacteriota bacterium]|nr:phospholipase D-like domain-containing protein [Acidobacteriota bacterium]